MPAAVKNQLARSWPTVALVAGIAVAATACSGSGGAGSARATTTAGAAATAAGGVAAAGTGGDASPLTTSVYWTRPFGGPDKVSVDGYTDPDNAPMPYVVFGSITNDGPVDVAQPTVTATFTGAGGTVVATSVGRVLTPDGATLDRLAPGASADVLVVVSDPVLGPTLNGSTVVLTGAGR